MDNFIDVVKESRRLNQIEKKDFNKIYKKDIIKQRFVQLYVTGLYNNRQIADILSVSESSIKKLLRTEEVMQQINSYQSEEKAIIDAKIKALRNKAMDVFDDLLFSEKDEIRLKVAEGILDRTGHGKKDEKDININVTYEERLQQLADGVDTSFIDTSYSVENDG